MKVPNSCRDLYRPFRPSHVESLTVQRARDQNRLYAAQGSISTPRCVIKGLKWALAEGERRIHKLRREAMDLVRRDETIQQRYDLLISIPGVAQISAIQLLGDRSLAELGLFADKNGAVPQLSIDVSVHSLRDLKFPDTYLDILKKHNVAAKDTIVEITASGLIQKVSTTLDVLTRLRLKQVQLSIDDFGIQPIPSQVLSE